MVRPLNPKERMAYAVAIRKARETKRLVKGAVASKLGQPIWMLDKVERGEPVIWHPNVYKKLEEILGLDAKKEELPSSSTCDSSLKPSQT